MVIRERRKAYRSRRRAHQQRLRSKLRHSYYGFFFISTVQVVSIHTPYVHNEMFALYRHKNLNWKGFHVLLLTVMGIAYVNLAVHFFRRCHFSDFSTSLNLAFKIFKTRDSLFCHVIKLLTNISVVTLALYRSVLNNGN